MKQETNLKNILILMIAFAAFLILMKVYTIMRLYPRVMIFEIFEFIGYMGICTTCMMMGMYIERQRKENEENGNDNN